MQYVAVCLLSPTYSICTQTHTHAQYNTSTLNLHFVCICTALQCTEIIYLFNLINKSLRLNLFSEGDLVRQHTISRLQKL